MNNNNNDPMDISPRRERTIYPQGTTKSKEFELDDNCELLGDICTILEQSLKFGFRSEAISKHLFIALHIYGTPTIIAYYPSKLIDQRVLIRNENTDRYFQLDCRTGLVGSLDRQLDGAAQLASLIILKKFDGQYIVKKGPMNNDTFTVIITQSDFPGERTVIKIN